MNFQRPLKSWLLSLLLTALFQQLVSLQLLPLPQNCTICGHQLLKGRVAPPGAKDTVKRVRKPPVQIRVEPIASEPVVEPVERVSTPRPKAVPKVETKQTVDIEDDPPTPRTLLREASRHFVTLRSLVHDKKKSEVVNMYTQKLTPWPA